MCEFIGVLSRVPGLAAAQLEAHSGGGGGGLTGDPGEEGLLEWDELARDEALAMTPTSLVRSSWFEASCYRIMAHAPKLRMTPSVAAWLTRVRALTSKPALHCCSTSDMDV